MNATARPSPSAITQALVPYPPRDRPSASRVSRSADEPPFERHRLLSGGPGCWCRPETSSRAGHHAPGPGAAAAPTRPGAPSGGRSAPPATRDQAQPGWRATWPRSDAARRWPTACAAGPEAGSCPWAGIPRSAAPASSSVRLSASLLLPSQEEQNARNPIQFKREQALERQEMPSERPYAGQLWKRDSTRVLVVAAHLNTVTYDLQQQASNSPTSVNGTVCHCRD